MTVEQRIEKLEQEVERLSAVRVVEATSLRLVGIPMLGLSDEQGKPRAVLALNEDGTGLVMSDEQGRPRTILALGASGSMLTLRDEHGEVRAGIALTKSGPRLAIYDEQGKCTWSAP
jgi:hypothetical protein